MIVRRFHLLPLFIAALWLPFQAIAAVAMPFCRHGEAHKAARVVTTEEHCHMHDDQAPPGGHGADHGPSCDDCGFCHLASAGIMPTPEHAGPMIPADSDYRPFAPFAPASVTLEPPQQPPKRLA